MEYLLDTHVLLWFLFDSKKLSPPVAATIQNRQHNIMVSAVSFWEIAIKYRSGKLCLGQYKPSDLPLVCLELGLGVLPVHAKVSGTFYKLAATHHKDPFDRMLIWQSLHNDYTFITADEAIKKYQSAGLTTLW
jgi:PIN domain nuclease of toxin-antitoxin system